MIVAQPRSLPTTFAIKVATKANLFVPPEEETGNEELWMDLRNRLADFQKLSLSTDFEKAMIAYWPMKLADDQLELLRIIYDTTKDWIMGHIVGELLIVLEGRLPNNKIEAAREIIDSFQNKGLLGDDKAGQTRKSLLVRFAETVN